MRLENLRASGFDNKDFVQAILGQACGNNCASSSAYKPISFIKKDL
jgi:hypothetical protein